MSQSWSAEDLCVWDALARAGHVPSDEQPSLLSVVNAAQALERQRILENLRSLSEAEQFILRNIITWISLGAPDHDPR